MKCGASGEEIGSAWSTFPKYHETPWGATTGCPKVPDSDNRIQVWPNGGPAGQPGMWCRQCGACENFEGGSVPGRFVPKKREATIDPDLPRQMHENLFSHREYFRKRLISDQVIDDHLLGWSADKNRYAIPCYYEGKLSGIQYRIIESAEEWCKENSIEYNKYVAETGSINKVPFNDVTARLPLLYIFLDESPLTALTIESLGWPCVSSFCGNNTSVGWMWPRLLQHIPEIIIIEQNDEAGSGIAAAKARDIPRARILSAPQGFKDLGEYLVTQADPVRAMYQWCGLPPILRKEKVNETISY